MAALSDELRCFNLVQAEIQGLYHEACLKLGLSDSASKILYMLAAFGEGCTQRDICRHFGLSRQTVHSSIRILSAQAVILLQKDSGRVRRIFLTEKGRMLIRERIEPLINMENELLESWSDGERSSLLGLLRKYRDDLRERVATLQAWKDDVQ